MTATTPEPAAGPAVRPMSRPSTDLRGPVSPVARQAVRPLIDLAIDGIARMYLPDRRAVPQTLRGVRTARGVTLHREGANDRYAAIVALGVRGLDPDRQAAALAGTTAADLALAVADRADGHDDLGVLALAAWAAAEAAAEARVDLFARLARHLSGDAPIPTVVAAWSLTAALATDPLVAGNRGRLDEVIGWSTRRLLAAQSEHGLFPHFLPPRLLGRWRAHVGSFADQVYPIQALARVAGRTGNPDALAAAARGAARVVRLQGPAGQWWWHYDVRDGSVVEGYPVYSVHQHGMAPMVLFDLAAAGGPNHADAVTAGVRWLTEHPEVFEDLIAPRHAVIWRKVGRREPRKAVRSVTAVLSSYRAGTRLPGRDTMFPPVVVDRECRPYELGWLLYAWHRAGSPGPERI